MFAEDCYFELVDLSQKTNPGMTVARKNLLRGHEEENLRERET